VRNLLALVLLCMVVLGQAQNPADSLRKLIHEADEPRHRIDLQNRLAIELLEINLEESFQTSSQALRESRKNKYESGEGWALAYQALYYKFSGQPQRAIDQLLQAERIAIKLDDIKLKALSYLHHGRSYRDIGILDSALHYYQLAETERMRQPDFYTLWQIYASISRLYLLKDDPRKGLEYAERSLKMAELVNRVAPIAYAYLDIGNCYRDQFEFERALEYYQKALDKNGQASWLLADYNDGIGQLYFLQGDFDKASQAISYVIKTYEAHNGRHSLSRSLIKMAQVLEEKGMYDISTEYIYKALKIAETSGYPALEAEAYYQMARISYLTGQLDGARSSLDKAEVLFLRLDNKLKIASCLSTRGIILMMKGQFDSSMMYHKRALDIRMASGNKIGISSSLYSIGALYLTRNQQREALDYFTRGLAYEEEIGDFYGVCQYKNNLGNIYARNGDFVRASEYLKSALALAQQSASREWISITYGNLSALSEKRGNTKEALEYYKLSKQLNDSIRSSSVSESLASSRILYEIDQKDKQIELLNKDRLLQEDQIRIRNFLLYGAITLVIILGLLAFIFFYYTVRLRRLNEDVQERNEEVQTQSEELQESNIALTNLNQEISTQREEIQNQAEELRVSHETIARINDGLEKMIEQRTTELRAAYHELDTFFYRSSHDFRRPLTTLMGLAEVAKLSVKDANALELFDKVNVTAVSLDKMLTKLQSISDVGSHQLVHKEVLLKSMINNALDAFRDTLMEKQARVAVDVKLDKPFFSFPVLIKIIVENLIENAIQFSHPEKPQIQIKSLRQNEVIVLEVEDNGEGIKEDVAVHIFEMFFRGSERSGGNGLGLYIASKAVEKVSGKISFENNAGRPGTIFRVEIPDRG
jgi:signal transduction histidine kinase